MTTPDSAVAPSAAPPAPKKKLNLPPRRTGPVLPPMDGRTARCPYCQAEFAWPPESLKCPSCGKQLRPPHGFRPKDREKRREAKEKISEARDRELRKLGDPASLRVGPTGYLIAVAALAFLGAALVSASRRPAVSPRKQRDPAAATTNLMDLYAMGLEHFRTDTGHYPDPRRELGLASLERNVEGWSEWRGPYVRSKRGLFQDGWGEPFVYRLEGDKPFLMSFGPDRKPDTGDEIVAPPELFRCHPQWLAARAALSRPEADEDKTEK